MSIGTGPCLCSLDTFHGFLSSPRVFDHQQIIHCMEPALLLIFVKPPFAPNCISQLPIYPLMILDTSHKNNLVFFSQDMDKVDSLLGDDETEETFIVSTRLVILLHA